MIGGPARSATVAAARYAARDDWNEKDECATELSSVTPWDDENERFVGFRVKETDVRYGKGTSPSVRVDQLLKSRGLLLSVAKMGTACRQRQFFSVVKKDECTDKKVIHDACNGEHGLMSLLGRQLDHVKRKRVQPASRLEAGGVLFVQKGALANEHGGSKLRQNESVTGHGGTKNADEEKRKDVICVADDWRIPVLVRPHAQHLVDLLRKRILYRDEHLVVIDKPCGLASQRGTDVSVSVR